MGASGWSYFVHLLRNLMELCQHDYSEFNRGDIDCHGLFG